MRPGTFSTRLDVKLTETQRVNQMIHQFGEWHNIPEHELFILKLTLDELVTNIVTHAKKELPVVQEIILRLKINKAEVMAEVEDDGVAFNPLDQEAPDLNASLEERSPGGLGILLARRLLDQIRYTRVGARNVVTLTKRVLES